MGRQHQGMDRPGVQQVPEGSGEHGKMEKTGCRIICGAPTILAVKGLMMMMMMNEEKDLGVIFDKSFSFKSISKVVYINKANKIIGVTKRTFTFLDKEIFNDLYKPLVRPPLEYCNIIWSPYLKRQSVTIKRVQRRATRLISTLRE